MRETFRYTPLLALLLAPNDWVHPSFGKYLFAACDILNGVLIYKLLVSVILPKAAASPASAKDPQPIDTSRLATFYASLHLLNPLVFTISTRGSSESVLASFVLLTLYCALRGRWDAAAVMLGASTHWKIYPLIYGVGCLGVVGRESGKQGEAGKERWMEYMRTIVNRRTVRFGVLSVGTFWLLGTLCYLVYVSRPRPS
jgi:GPI mannosyltransferase 1 subunit M